MTLLIAQVSVTASLAASATPASAVFLTVDEPDKSTVSPGVAGFLVTFGLALATLFLIRSMVKHLRKVRYSPEPGAPHSPEPGVPHSPEPGVQHSVEPGVQPKVPGPRPEGSDRRKDPDPGAP